MGDLQAGWRDPGSTVREIGKRVGLSASYGSRLHQSSCVGATSNVRVSPHIHSTLPMTQLGPSLDWYVVPEGIMEELKVQRWQEALGQGILIRDCKNCTALVTIAQAAMAQLNGLVDLLGCLLWSLDNYSLGRRTIYGLSWKHKEDVSCTATMVIGPTVEGGCVLGLPGDNLFRRHFNFDTMEVLGWLECVFHPTLSAASKCLQLTVVKPKLLTQQRIVSVQLDDLALTANLGLQTGCLSLKQSFPITYQVDRERAGLWRKLILGGIVLDNRRPSWEPEVVKCPTDEYKDCLVLTAMALHSLFDNSLVRIPGCQCTWHSSTTRGMFLICQKKMDDWFIWRIETDETKICFGKQCNLNVQVEGLLDADSPCILC